MMRCGQDLSPQPALPLHRSDFSMHLVDFMAANSLVGVVTHLYVVYPSAGYDAKGYHREGQHKEGYGRCH